MSHKDFDAHRKTYEDVSFTMFGKEYLLSPDPPGKPLLEIWERRLRGELPTSRESMGPLMTPPDGTVEEGMAVFDELMDRGLGARLMNDLVDWILEEYGFDVDEAVKKAADILSGPGPVPNRETRRAANKPKRRAS